MATVSDPLSEVDERGYRERRRRRRRRRRKKSFIPYHHSQPLPSIID